MIEQVRISIIKSVSPTRNRFKVKESTNLIQKPTTNIKTFPSIRKGYRTESKTWNTHDINCLTVNAIKNGKLKAHIHNNAITKEPNLEKGRHGSICIYYQHKKKQSFKAMHYASVMLLLLAKQSGSAFQLKKSTLTFGNKT